MRSLLLAFQFLTVLPLGKGQTLPTDRLGRSMAFFPLVGAVIGGILILADHALSLLLPPSLTTLLVLLIWVVLTGGIHLDGFADTVDGLAGGRDRESRLAIMRDSRIGAFATIGLFFLLGMKLLCLMAIPEETKGWALWIAPILGRWAMVLLAGIAPPAREEGLGHLFLQGPKGWILGAATGTVLIGVGVIPGGMGWGLWIGVAAIAVSAGVTFRRRLGGITGDTLGATCEISETAVLLGVSIAATVNVIQ